jgi:hypothetical protein
MKVSVTVTIGRRVVPLEQVTDRRISAGLDATARQVANALERVRCPTHGKPASNVRLHFEANGAADLRYDSCCAALGDAVSKVLG